MVAYHIDKFRSSTTHTDPYRRSGSDHCIKGPNYYTLIPEKKTRRKIKQQENHHTTKSKPPHIHTTTTHPKPGLQNHHTSNFFSSNHHRSTPKTQEPYIQIHPKKKTTTHPHGPPHIQFRDPKTTTHRQFSLKSTIQASPFDLNKALYIAFYS